MNIHRSDQSIQNATLLSSVASIKVAIFTLPHQAVILTIAAHRSTMSGKASLEISQESVLQQGKVIFGPTQEHP